MLVPGAIKQVEILLKDVSVKEKKILVAGCGLSEPAKKILNAGAESVEIITNDYECFLQTRMELGKESNIDVKIMDYTATDYKTNTFDLIFAQASLSVKERNKIVKEFRKILKPASLLCSGEIVKLKKNIPAFVNNMFNESNLQPLFIDDVESYYAERKFELTESYDLSFTLKEYYSGILNKVRKAEGGLTSQEKSYYKKLLNRIHHEANIFLKLGGEKYFGFRVFLLLNRKDG